MGLVRGMTSLNTKKYKRKIVSEKEKIKLSKDLKAYNKHLRKQHLHGLQMTLTEYIDYVQGYYKPKQAYQNKHTPIVNKLVSGPTLLREPFKGCSVNGNTLDSKSKTSGSNPFTSATVPSHGSEQRSWKEQAERIEISKQYSVVPAYNKGPYMVVSREELLTAGKKV